MPESLQELLERINRDYLQTAEDQKKAILENAAREAEAALSAARIEAAGILDNAARQVEALRKRYADEMKRAFNETVRELRTELARLLAAAVGQKASEAMTPAFMAGIIGQMAEAAPQGAVQEAAILTHGRNIEELRRLIPGTLRARIESGDFKGGMQLSLGASGEYFDFSERAVREFLRERLGRELNALLDGAP